MFCMKCGQQIPDTAKFCSKCGAATGVQDAAALHDAVHTANETPPQAPPSQPHAPAQNQQPAQQTFLRKGKTERWTDADFNTEQENFRALVGPNASYYLEQFFNIQEKDERKTNWAAFFLGLYHAAYRNMWREYVQMCYIPFLITQASGLLGLFAIASFSFNLTTLLIPISIGGMIGTGVRHIQFAMRFNTMYMHHIDDMLHGRVPHQPGANGKAAAISVGITLAVVFIDNLLSSAVMMSMLY
ncbi:zinc ribbon domain-containing protein [Agathobaculum sp.]|uniref:zinc ribbon domain-containing protein n=1 Tax=Agathobaculum sp. TaxID=2048138 RepID=UPI002A7ED835|nr:zinc ribbon domain-containing protein [Agathobaculum sp.]MDY3617785.1 zinc ribbon domain-containing protein [Agathobaculum sp.]